jgi:hypothetical protein
MTEEVRQWRLRHLKAHGSDRRLKANRAPARRRYRITRINKTKVFLAGPPGYFSLVIPRTAFDSHWQRVGRYAFESVERKVQLTHEVVTR